MKMKTTKVDGTYEILAAYEFVGIPIKLETSAKGGSVQTTDGREGILLYDVDVDANPNGCLVVAGVIDMRKVQKHLGEDFRESDYASLPDTLVLRTNVGVNE